MRFNTGRERPTILDIPSNEQMIYELKLLQTLVSSMKAFNLFISLVYFNLQSGCLNNIMNESKIFYIEQILSDKLKSLARESNKWQTYTDRQYGRQSLHWRPHSEKNSDKCSWLVTLQTDRQPNRQPDSQPANFCLPTPKLSCDNIAGFAKFSMSGAEVKKRSPGWHAGPVLHIK